MDKLEKTNSGGSRALATKDNDATTGLRVLQLLDDKQLVAAENFIKRVMGSPKSGISNVQEGLAVLMRANDLQLPFSSCLALIFTPAISMIFSLSLSLSLSSSL